MRLRALLSEVAGEAMGPGDGIGGKGLSASVNGAGDPEINNIVMDSAQAGPGSLFVCVKGARSDGHQYAAQAVARGAVAIVAERPTGTGVPEVLVASARQVLGPLSAAFWGHPSRAMKVVGVTGTNGKTTTCALLASIFEAQGWRPGVIGTLTGSRTTPEAPLLHSKLAELRDNGAKAVAMEVSSHSLEQFRTLGTQFRAGVFTNLSQDHLDYHATMDAYFEAKAKLFGPGSVLLAVVNRSGPWGAKLARRVEASPVPLVTFGPRTPASWSSVCAAPLLRGEANAWSSTSGGVSM